VRLTLEIARYPFGDPKKKKPDSSALAYETKEGFLSMFCAAMRGEDEYNMI
jgi:hypothetical protein